MNFNNFNEIELDNEMFKNMYNQNYKIFYMPTIKFDEFFYWEIDHIFDYEEDI